MKKRYWIAGATGLAGGALALKFATRPRDVVWAEQKDRLHHADKSRFIEIEGVRVHYQEAGERGAPVLLLIHGFAASNFVWSEALMPLASAGFRVLAPDMVGFGFSDKPRDGDYTIEAQARVIVSLMNELGIERATLVGSSYGGAVASVCALDNASRVERLVLVSPVINDELKRNPLFLLARVPVLGELSAPVLVDAREFVKKRLRRMYGADNGHLLEEKRVAAHVLPLRAASTQRALLRTARQWSCTRVEREAGNIRQPTLLIWGAQDKDVPLRHGQRLHGLIPHSRLYVFPNCGHLPQEERPTEFSSLVAEFCKSVDG